MKTFCGLTNMRMQLVIGSIVESRGRLTRRSLAHKSKTAQIHKMRKIWVFAVAALANTLPSHERFPVRMVLTV